jgi:hypothetical protein
MVMFDHAAMLEMTVRGFLALDERDSRPEQMSASGYAHNLGKLALGRSKGMGIWR